MSKIKVIMQLKTHLITLLILCVFTHRNRYILMPGVRNCKVNSENERRDTESIG